MSQFNQITKKVNIATGATVRIWDNPHGAPIKNMTVIFRSSGYDISKITQEVFLGGHFVNGSSQVVSPYTVDSTHTSGVSQAAAAAIGTGLIGAHTIYSNTGILPANSPDSPGGILMPFVVSFKSTNITPVNIEVTFISETLNSTV